MLEALDATIDEPSVIFGNSMGGLAAIQYALARPERVRGLVLCSPGGAPMTPDELDRFLATFRVERHADALAFVDRLFTKRPWLRQLIAWGVRRNFQHPNMRALLASVSSADLLRPEDVRALQPPTLFIWGRTERILPPEHLSFFRENLPPHAAVDEPEHFGHSPYLEAPAAVMRRIVRFLSHVHGG
jgi:pimeloyl-ACP methyl ester carboxylesterase